MADPTAADPGHLLPDEDWAAVVADAQLQAARIAAEATTPRRLGAVAGGLALSGTVAAPSNGGRRPRGAPTFGVLHTAETPLEAGYAAAIARYFAGGPGTSCTWMTDPAETWGVLNPALIAWHCGNGNPNSVALEQAGRASFTRAQWLTDLGLAQLRRNAAVMRECRRLFEIGTYWMTDQQLRDAHAGRIVGGWATHDQCRRVLFGTTHTDPAGANVGPVPTGDRFPFDVQMSLAAQATDTPEDDDMMTPEQAQQLRELHVMMDALKGGAEAGLFRPFFEAAAVAGAAAALRTEGVSGAGDVGRLAAELTARLEQGATGGPAGALTRADVEAAVRAVFGDAAVAG